MKIAKSYKYLILIAVLLLSVTMFFAFNSTAKVKAESDTYIVSSSTCKINNILKDDGNDVVAIDHTESITLVKDYKYDKDLTLLKDSTAKTLDNGLTFDDSVGYVSDDKYFCVTNVGETKLKIDGENSGITVNVIDEDIEAPKYLEQAKIKQKNIDNFKKQLNTNIHETVDEKEYYKPLGTSKYIKIPSMDKFIEDSSTNYNELKYKVYYKNNTTDSNYSGSDKVGDTFQLPVAVAGDYTFYVAFIDIFGNEMKEDDIPVYMKFSFTILDDYPLEIKVLSNPSKGYVGTKYTLGTASFDVTSNSTKTYELLFSATKDGNFKDVTKDEDVSFSTNDLSFTPQEKGFYKVKCTAKKQTTNNSGALNNFNEIVIEIGDEATVINEPDSAFVAWVKGHVVSVVFLCLGFVCLVAIVVLIFIKPKEEIEEPIEIETKTKNKNK